MFHAKRLVRTLRCPPRLPTTALPCHRRFGSNRYNRTSGPEWIFATFSSSAAAIGIVGASAAAVVFSSSSFGDYEYSLCVCEGQQVNSKSKKDPGGGGTFRLQDTYEIEQVLGEGAYGTVYKARRKADDEIVALKTMSRSLTGKTDFEREVAALQILSKPPGHEHIVQLYDLHRDDSNYYLSMEYIEGGELLEHLIENGAYSEGIAANFLRQFAEAICYVHSNGLAHADLKPENLLLSSNDMDKARLKLADFGAARSHDLSRKDMLLPAQEFATGCSFLHMVALGNQFELEKMLMERPTLVNFRDYDFRTPLHLAASEGHVDICRFLVERGGRVNRSDRWGGSPLDDAHRHRHSEVIQYLRQQGATFGTLTQLPRFIQAASEGDQEEVRALLEFGNIDLDEGDYDRRTAMHLACGEGRIEIVEMLCAAGADPNVEDRWGNRPLDDAGKAKKNSTRIMKLLVSYGAKSSKNPSLAKQSGLTDSADNTLFATKPTRRKHTEDEETSSGTIAYWPPELFKDGGMATPASDMWAAGVIKYICLTGSHPFDEMGRLTDEEVQDAVLAVCGDKDSYTQLMNERVFNERVQGLSESCVELMRSLLHPDPVQRMSSENFLRHPWIQGLTASWTTMGKTHDDLKAFWQNKFRAEIKKKFAKSLGISREALSDSDLERIFNALDLNHSGVLELDNIQAAFHDLGLSEKNIRTIFASADLDGSGSIKFDEFRALLNSKGTGGGKGVDVDYLQNRFKYHILGTNETQCDKGKLREIFDSIDTEGNGKLDPHNIRVVLRSAGEPEDVITRIVASLDLNRRGNVSWDDFLTIMMKED